MIVVATENFEVYHDVVAELRDRGVAFTTVEPGATLLEQARVLVVSAADVLSLDSDDLDRDWPVEVVSTAPTTRKPESTFASIRVTGWDDCPAFTCTRTRWETVAVGVAWCRLRAAIS